MSVPKIERKYLAGTRAEREKNHQPKATAHLSDEKRLGSIPKAFHQWPSSARRGDGRKTLRSRESPRQTIQEIESISGSRLEKKETGSVQSGVHRHRTQNPS